MRLIRSALSVGSFTVLSRIAGFAREWLQAHYLGVSVISDAIGYAISFPSFFRRIFAEGAFNASFVPLFTSTLTGEGRESARSFAQDALSLLSGIVSIVIILVELFIHVLMPFFLPGFKSDPERLRLTIEFTRITFPFLLFISLTAFFSGMLNSLERFIAAASSPFVGNLAIIFTLIFMVDLGTDPGSALAAGILACGVVQFLWVFVPSQRSGVTVRLKWPTITPTMKIFLKRLLPAVLGSGVVQINLLVDMALSSFLPRGAYSSLKYAERFSQLPLSVIGTAISTALLPMLAKALRQGDTEKAMFSQNRAIEFTLFFIIPATAGLLCMSYPLIDIFYQHGEFKGIHVEPVANTLILLATGLPAYVLVKVFSTSFFSRGDTTTPLLIAIASVVMNFVLNLALIWHLHQLGLAISISLAAWFNAGCLAFFLKRANLLTLDTSAKKFIYRILFVFGVLCCVLYYGTPIVIQILDTIIPWTWINLILSTFLGAAIYLIIGFTFKAFSKKKLLSFISNRE